MNRLTVTVITRDEEKNLPRLLDSVAGLADEVVVVDSASTDRTRELARERGARVLERAWTDFSDQKNFAAAQATHDWILNLDADEEVSPALRDELRRWKNEAPSVVAYALPRRANYLGRWILHSDWYPDPKVRLYRRDRASFAGRLHEAVVADGPVGRLRGDLYHHTFATRAEHRTQTERYAELAAAALVAEGRRRWLLPLVFGPPWMWLRTFVLKLGFLDGAAGWAIAWETARSTLLKYLALRRTLQRESAPSSAVPADSPGASRRP
jgi:glycosyltransferase involved in cell wall biosynthesis